MEGRTQVAFALALTCGAAAACAAFRSAGGDTNDAGDHGGDAATAGDACGSPPAAATLFIKNGAPVIKLGVAAGLIVWGQTGGVYGCPAAGCDPDAASDLLSAGGQFFALASTKVLVSNGTVSVYACGYDAGCTDFSHTTDIAAIAVQANKILGESYSDRMLVRCLTLSGCSDAWLPFAPLSTSPAPLDQLAASDQDVFGWSTEVSSRAVRRASVTRTGA